MVKSSGSLVARLLMAATFSLAACGSDGGTDDTGDVDAGGDDEGVPTAPSNLAVAELGGGAHLTWTDNSDDETEFMLMRMAHPDGYEEIASPPFDTTQYHDAALTSGTTYMYKVMATNAAGDSGSSNEVEFVAP